MPTAVIMPKFEMSQETGRVAAWVKAEGDVVRKGDVILEVETDKVTMEVEAPAAGVLVGIAARPGEVVPVGQTIAYVAAAGEAFAGAASSPPAQMTAAGRDPAPAEPVGSASPLALRVAQSLGVDPALVQGTGVRGQVTREDVEAYAAARQAASASDGSSTPGAVRAVPAARRLARELGVDVRMVPGTGPAGRIQSEDVRAFAGASAAADAVSAAPSAISDASRPAVRRLVPLTNIRRTIAERMTASVREAPQFTVGLDADMARALAVVEDLRGGGAGDSRPRVTLTALLVKACAWALCQHPGANAAYQDGLASIAEWAEVNIGVATAVEAGLIVPVIHRADRLGLRAIAARLADLTARARENRLKIEDLQRGTFTLSNLGMFGIDRFTAILNPPQAAILAVGQVAKRPVALADDRVEVRPMAALTLTADHRVLDGVTSAQFLATIQRALEHPGLLLE